MAITFEFEPFPLFQVKSTVPDHWLRVDKARRPSIIDPRNVARSIALGKQVMAIIERNQVYYVASNNPEYPYPGLVNQIPICFEQEQDWAKLVPWDQLAVMTVRKMGNYIVFTDWYFDNERITTRSYQTIPRLNAFVLTAKANL